MRSALERELLKGEAACGRARGFSAQPGSTPLSACYPEGLDARSAGDMHDLRNMLAVAMSGTNLLRAPLDAVRRSDIVDAVQQAIRCAERLVTSLVGTGGKAATQKRWVDVGALLARDSALYLCDLPANIWLRIQTSSKLPLAWLDQAMLETALYNLVLNARDAMPSGGCLTIRAKKLSRHIRLIVADTGVGMDAETLRQVGTPFVTHKPGRGTGLGLAQVRRFLKQADGRLAVRSRPGRGTVFVLDLSV